MKRYKHHSPSFYISTGVSLSAIQVLMFMAMVPNIWANEVIVEQCIDGIDNDQNGYTDCMDPACGDFILCQQELCTDGEDNDNDGYTDCDDANCFHTDECPAKEPEPPEVKVIREIVEVQQPKETVIKEVKVIERVIEKVGGSSGGGPQKEKECQDGIDNDGNGLTDCSDANCGSHPKCITVTKNTLTEQEIELLDG